jgi:class 3 adenylate cyclase
MYTHKQPEAGLTPQAHADRSRRPSKPALFAAAAALALVALLCPTARAQSQITGVVLDEAELPLAGAVVLVKDDATGRDVLAVQTTRHGTFSIPVPSPGTYEVTIAAAKQTSTTRLMKVRDGESAALKVRLVDWRYVLIPYLINLLCVALILILLDFWLRSRGVKDPSLLWLYLTLLSWALAIAVELFNFDWLRAWLRPWPWIQSEQYKYLFSIASSLLFTVAAFRLSRVREFFRASRLRRVPSIVTGVVIGISAVALFLMFSEKYHEKAPSYDAAASMLASLALCASLIYSFLRYGNQPLAWLAACVFGIFIWRQYSIASEGTPASGMGAAFFFADSALLVMLFIALAVAWGLSDASRLRPVGGAPDVQVAALFFDLRGSTQWANNVVEHDRNYVRNFLDELREWALSKADASRMGRPNMVKFLGDGFMWVWEVNGDNVPESADRAADLGCHLRNEYLAWVKGKDFRRKFPWGAPAGIGVGVDIGPAIRITFENGSDDYLGAPVNMAAKMQGLARPHGVAITAKLYGVLEDLKSAFTKETSMKLGDREILVRLTEDAAR